MMLLFDFTSCHAVQEALMGEYGLRGAYSSQYIKYLWRLEGLTDLTVDLVLEDNQ